ncbi:DUF3558 domain-containing protein [Nocardia sp. BSTN01]|uniref:DUF3558 family protein n=1 Tax=Nocardia sp. BSTN01 TaxID=2783665 RepID=UPI00188E069D|nr:DUF3558 family protein [Nocardia sp. BSTN01]MBF4998295.1 DUF3558 domain-containing protein [Nocardia sp. BSTN01]
MRMVRFATAAVVAVGLLTGCSSHPPQAEVRQAVDPNFLAGCGPVGEPVIARAVDRSTAIKQSSPPTCAWAASGPDADTVDVTYAWLSGDTLARELQIAQQSGYQVEKFVVKRFAGFYWHDPRDPGHCGATAADTGTVTWWVRNRSHTPHPDDPCAAAMTLMQQTLLIDGT